MGVLDFIAMASYAALVLWIGVRAGSARSAGREDLLLADRDLPTWAVFASMVATELSAATFVGVPHAAYTGDWSFLQLAFGALAAKFVLAWRVIPLYHERRVTTVYGFLEERFGPRTRRSAARCFVAGRIFASGARLFIAALAFSAATGWALEWTILLSALVAGLYTSVGGLRAVVYTDALQAIVLVTGAAAVIVVLLTSMGADSAAFLSWARDGERLRVFHAQPFLSLRDGGALGSALFAGFFLTLATHATDHDMVQRLLAARSGRAGGRALWGSALMNFPMTALFLTAGSLIAFHHFNATPSYDLSDTRQVLPLFAFHELPDGARGLVFAGLFAAAMSSLDSAICAISATWVSDIAPDSGAHDNDATRARIRKSTILVCCALAGAALLMSGYQTQAQVAGTPLPSLVEFALSAMSILYGALLGVFAVAILRSRRSADVAGTRALWVGGVLGLALFLHPLLGTTWIAWGFWIPLTAGVTACVACMPTRTRDARAATAIG